MTQAAVSELALRLIALVLAGWGARFALTYGGRIALEQGAFLGVGAFAYAALAEEVARGWAAAGGVGLSALLGGLLGASTAALDPARAAALGLTVQLLASRLGPALPWTGGHMGRALVEPSPSRNLALAAVAAAALLAVTLITRGRDPLRLLARLRLLVEARPLALTLGLDEARLGALAGSISAAAAGLGGVLLAVSLEHLHVRSFGLEQSFSVLAVGLVGGSPAAIALGALVLVALEEGLAHLPALRVGVLGAVFVGAAIRLGNRGRRASTRGPDSRRHPVADRPEGTR